MKWVLIYQLYVAAFWKPKWRCSIKIQRIMHIVGGLAIAIGCSITAANIKDEVSIFESYGLLFIAVGVGMYIVPLFIKEK